MPRKPVMHDPQTIGKWAHVSVKWEDAYEKPGAHNSADFIEAYEACMRHTMGWFLGSDNLRVFLTQTKDVDAQLDDGDDCDGILVIPLAMIVELKSLTPRKRKPKNGPIPSPSP